MIHIFGHKSPDTDSTTAAIVYSWFYNEILKRPATAYVLGEPNREAQYVLERFGFKQPEVLKELESGSEVILVDTNNPEELTVSLSDAKLIGIVDHHKLAGSISTSEPIHVTMKPVACTSSILFMTFERYAVVDKIPKNIAGLMLSAILSDTLNFSSPTTTQEDRDIATQLVKITGENPDELADKMFDAKSDMTGMSPRDILLADSKVFDMNGKKVRITSIETVKPENVLALDTQLIESAKVIKTEEQLNGFFIFVIDILKQESNLIMIDDFELEVATKAFSAPTPKGNCVILPGVVSRKKQIVPSIEGVVA